jgi:hypothetical protein
MSDSLSRKLGLALVRGDNPALRLRVASGQAELSAEDVLELNTLLLELYADVVPISRDEAEDDTPSTPIAWRFQAEGRIKHGKRHNHNLRMRSLRPHD